MKWGDLEDDVCLRTDEVKSDKTPPSKSALMLFFVLHSNVAARLLSLIIIPRENHQQG